MQFGERGGPHDRQRAAQPLASVRSRGYPGIAQRDPEDRGERRVIGRPGGRAGAVDVGQVAVRALHRPRPPRGRPPRTACSSSGYFTTTLIVASAASADRRPAPSSVSAPAQVIASEMPGGLVRSSPRSRETAVATSPASAPEAPGTRRRMIAATRAGVRVADPVVKAPALQRVVQVTGPVGGQDRDRRKGRLPGAQLRDRDGRFGQQLEQERLELVVGPVYLVDEQHRGSWPGVVERGEQRPRKQELLAEQVPVGHVLVRGLGQPDGEQLAGVVPLVERLGGRDALVALQPHQRRCRAQSPRPSPPRSCRHRARLRAGWAAPFARPGTAPPRAGRRPGTRPCPGLWSARRRPGTAR